jgi:MFS family permease
MAFASVGWGTLADRIGPRAIAIAGTLLLAASLLLAAHAPTLIAFQLAFGLLVGLAAAAVLVPMMAAVTGWFDTHRSLAVSLVSAGMGMAPLTMSPLAAWLIARTDWRTAYDVLAGVVVVLMVPAALLVRRPPALAQPAHGPADAAESGSGLSLAEAVRSPPFLALVLTNFCCCATHSGPIFHTVSYAMACGIAPLAAVSIYSLEGLAGMGGRLAFGLLGDRFGAKPTLVGGLLVQAFGALFYVFARDLGAFYAVAALFGFTYAGVMPLYAVLARENFPLRMMGTIIGSTAMAGSLGMAAGPVVGGWIYDATASYAWLYIGSFGIGMGAFLIALTFRPFPSTPTPVPLAA